jgi:ligand-binding sensor domain-containing protein
VRYGFLFFILILTLRLGAQNNFPAIGVWREHLPYHSAIDVTSSGKKIYCATPFSLFSVDISTDEIERISRVAGLSETGISTIKYDPVSKKLLIAYANSNIDMIDEKGIHNIPDLKRKNSSGDKTIYHIFPDNDRWYLSTGLGVIVVDANKSEIKDSWLIGSNGNFVKTNAFTKSNNFFYAATKEGLKKVSVTNNNPADFNNWQMVSGTNGLSSSECKSVMNLQNKTIALINDSLFAENGNAWNLFFTNGWPVVSINSSENKLFVCQRKQTGESQVIVLNADGTTQKTIQQPGIIAFPKNAISVNGNYWIADFYDGLSKWSGNNYESYKLNSPEDVSSGAMTVYDDILYATAGSVNDSWNYQYNRAGIFKFAAGGWTNYNQFSFPVLDSLMDFITVAVDLKDQSVWAGSYGGGLLHIKSNGQFEIFKQNSPIAQTIGDPGSYRVSGLAFDHDNNLWVSNYGANYQLHVLKKDGSWKSFSAPFALNENSVSQIVIDDADQKWIVSPKGNGLLVFNDNNTIDNTADDRWKLYKEGTGLGNLPSANVLSIAKDISGFIWVGTSNGIAIIQCPNEVFTSSGCETIWPVIKEGNFANYLFKGQEVRSIAVDGADRKWIATPDGAWLVNADGDKVIQHFTEDNSALLSNDVKSIAINGTTGEVFFATAKGISSFRAAATEAEETKDNVLVFPNPVPPAFNGDIGIRGLPKNSIVKITETNGRLVYQTRSLGGQATWNGKDYKGRQASSGIYLVIAEDENKQEKVVAKIVFISK